MKNLKNNYGEKSSLEEIFEMNISESEILAFVSSLVRNFLEKIRLKRVQTHLNNIFSDIEKHDIRIEKLIMNAKDYAILRNLASKSMIDLDIEDDKKTIERGVMAKLWGAYVIVEKDAKGILALPPEKYMHILEEELT